MAPSRARGRAACNQCRSRKQKCDETRYCKLGHDGKRHLLTFFRPICSRCAEFNKPCQWPGLKRRGPAKGYTEALEQRLSATESVLLRLLSVTDMDTMQSAFAEYNDAQIQIQEHRSNTTNKAELATYWEQFPLSNVDDIIKWANQYCINPNTSDQAASSGQQNTHAVGQSATTPLFRGSEVATGAPRTDLPYDMAADLTRSQSNVDPMQENIAARHHRVQVQRDSSEEVLQDSFDMPEQFKEQYIW